jgi:Sensors of blue-light using FAD
MPYQVIYSSESAMPMQMDDLEDILESARECNADAGITGALVYVDGFFLQILEGDGPAVRALMGRIAQDVRHETVTVLKEGEIPAAIFSEWKMAYVSATAEQVAKWAGFTGTAALPDILSDMHNDPTRVTQVALSILSVLASTPDAEPTDP